jgi:hypothetical protein
MQALTIIPPVVLLLLSLGYVFWSQTKVVQNKSRTRLDYLRERQGVLFENLRDLNFEYRAGKYQAEDYADQRHSLEDEAGRLLMEIQRLEASATPEVAAR